MLTWYLFFKSFLYLCLYFFGYLDDFWVINIALTVIVLIFALKKSKLDFKSALLIIIDGVIYFWASFIFAMIFILNFTYKRIYKKDDTSIYDLPLGEDAFQNFSTERKNLIRYNKDFDAEMKLHDSFKVQPYIDILEGHNTKLKLNAIQKLSKITSHSSVTLLNHALNDEKYEVRYFANNALELIEKVLYERLESLTKTIDFDPDDEENFNARAEHYLFFCGLDILDKETQKFFMGQALSDCLYSLELNPHQVDVLLRVIKIYTFNKDWKEVIEKCNILLSLEIEDTLRAKSHFYRAEAQFNLGNYSETQKDCKVVNALKFSSPKVSESSNWWSEN